MEAGPAGEHAERTSAEPKALTALSARRSALLGLDAPTRVAVEAAVGAQHPPTYRGTYVKIKYANQVREAPPVFVFFCNHPEGVGESYRRYLENKLRAAFGFVGVPLTLSFRKK